MVNIDDRLIHQLNEDELFLLLKIAVRMRTYRMNAWPSTEKIADDCGWDERKVKKVRNGLVISNHLGVQFRSGRSNVYTFKCNIGLYYGMQDIQMEEEVTAENAPSTESVPPTKSVPPTPYQKCTPYPPHKMHPEDINQVEEIKQLKDIKQINPQPQENDVFENELSTKKKRTQKKDTPGARRELLSKNGKVILPENYTGAAMDSFNEVLEAKSKEKKLEITPYNWEQSRQRDFASIKKIVEMVSLAVVEKEFLRTKEFVTIQPEKITQAVKIFFGGAFDYFYAIHETKGGGVMFAPSSCQRNFNYIIQNILNANKTGSNNNHKSSTTKKHEALANTVIGLRERAYRSLYGDDNSDQNNTTMGANRTIEI